MEKTANLELALINPSEWATTYSKDFLNALMGVDGSSNMSKIDAAVAALEEAVRTIPSPITGETVTAKATVGISKGNVVRLERLDGAYVAAMATSTTEATQYWLGIADNDIAAEQTGSVTMVVAVTSSPSVYQQAVAAGYTGTAEDFGRALANIDKKPNAKEVSFSGAESGMASADVQAAIEEVHLEAINKSTTASNVSFDPSRTTMKSTTAQDAFVELFTNVSDGKRQVASAVTDKGVPTSEDATFSIIAEHVRAISTGTDTSDANITAADVRSGKVGYGKDGKIVGAAPDVAVPTPVISVSSGGLITASATQNTGFVAGGSANATQQLPTQNALTIQPRTFTQSVQGQHYLLGDIDVLGDANLKPENIKDGVTIFGVNGTAKVENRTPSSVTILNTSRYDFYVGYVPISGDTQVAYISAKDSDTIQTFIGAWVCFSSADGYAYISKLVSGCSVIGPSQNDYSCCSIDAASATVHVGVDPM